MTTLDKYILRGLLVNYLIAIGVMMSLYVVLDLFFNMDEFTESAAGAKDVFLDVTSFYGNRVFLYFAQLSGAITLFACLVTLARMRRMNELTALLVSGVSLYRIAAPVVAFAVLSTSLWYVDTEICIPSIAHKLARRHDDARGLKTYGVWFLRDRNDALLSAQQYLPSEQLLKRLLVLKRSSDGVLESVLQADRARWEAPSDETSSGRWQLERGWEPGRIKRQDGGLGPQGDIGRRPVTHYESDLDPKTIEMRQSAGWIRFLSSRRLAELSERLEGQLLVQARHAKATRFTTPLVNLLLLLLGLPFILDRIPGNILASGGKALLICGSCFLLTFVTQNLGGMGTLSALPAWLPIIIFAPVAVVFIDRMRT